MNPSGSTQQSLEGLLQDYHPTGFLEQLGRASGEIVGLGEPYIFPLTDDPRLISFPVQSKNCVLGKYVISLFQGGHVDLTYVLGMHPMKGSREISLLCCVGAVGGNRLDRNKEVIFPGIEGIDRNLDDNTRTIKQDYANPTIVPTRISIPRSEIIEQAIAYDRMMADRDPFCGYSSLAGWREEHRKYSIYTMFTLNIWEHLARLERNASKTNHGEN